MLVRIHFAGFPVCCVDARVTVPLLSHCARLPGLVPCCVLAAGSVPGRGLFRFWRRRASLPSAAFGVRPACRAASSAV